MKVNIVITKTYYAIFNNLQHIELNGKIFTKGPFGCGQNFKSRITEKSVRYVSKENIQKNFQKKTFRISFRTGR